MTTTTERICTHHKFPISAPDYMWNSMGWEVYSNVDVISRRRSFANDDSDELLAIASANGLSGVDALRYYAEEHQRRSEEKTRATAVSRQAEAINNLAASLRSESDRTVLEKVMGQLTEPTQWAVRKQLAGTGILPND